MAIIQFGTGQKVNFNGTPTPQDVDEVAQQLGITSSNQVQFKQSQPETFSSDNGGFFANLFGGANKMVRTVQAAGAVGVGAAEQGVGAVTGNKNLQQIGQDLVTGAAANQPQPIVPQNNIVGGEAGKYLSQPVTPMGYDNSGKKLSTGQALGQAIGTGAQIASYFAPTSAVTKGIGWLSRLGISSLAGAANLGGGEAQKPGSTAGSIAGQTALGAVTGPLAEAGVEAAFKGISATAKAVSNVIDPDIEEAFTRAIKPGKNNTNWATDIKTALPEIADTLKEKGVDVSNMTMQDLQGAIKDTKNKVWDLFEAKLSPNSHVTFDTSSIADKIESGISKRMEMLSPNVVDGIRATADQYRAMGKMTLGDAEDFLQEANGELQTYYAKNKVGQRVAQTDPSISSTLKEAEALRESLYSKLDDLTGKGASQIKKLYGALSNIGNEVDGRAAVVARQAPASLQETIHTPLAVAKGIGSALSGNIVGVGEAAAQIGMSQAMKAANSSEGLVQKAFSKLLKL